VALVLGAHTEKEGVGGVKIEDHAFVTETGLEVYSTFPRGPYFDAAMEGHE
jgi:Xaa-Pro aminopeptidase